MTVRTILAAVLLAAAGVPAAGVPAAGQDADYAYPAGGYDTDGQSVDSIAVFFEPLSHYGRWLDSRYGRVWSPNVARDWRPYTIGHWEDGPYGQTWRSDEPFGWAVFHFGRWAYDQQIGWVWSPDTVWGPGWVAWRDSDDVTGWAPLPPQVSVYAGADFGFNDWGYDQWYQPGWVYVPRGYLYARSLRGVYYPYARNRDFWDHTRGVTRYDRVDGQIVNRSFGSGRWRGGDRRGGFGGGDRREGLGNGDRRGGFGGGERRDFGRDLRGGEAHGGTAPRDATRTDLRGAYPRGSVPAPPFAPPASSATPRGFGGHDGFVPGTSPHGFDRRPMSAPGVVPPGVVPPAGAAVRPALTPPPMARPQPVPQAAPRPAPPPPQLREPNPNERPR